MYSLCRDILRDLFTYYTPRCLRQGTDTEPRYITHMRYTNPCLVIQHPKHSTLATHISRLCVFCRSMQSTISQPVHPRPLLRSPCNHFADLWLKSCATSSACNSLAIEGVYVWREWCGECPYIMDPISRTNTWFTEHSLVTNRPIYSVRCPFDHPAWSDQAVRKNSRIVRVYAIMDRLHQYHDIFVLIIIIIRQLVTRHMSAHWIAES